MVRDSTARRTRANQGNTREEVERRRRQGVEAGSGVTRTGTTQDPQERIVRSIQGDTGRIGGGRSGTISRITSTFGSGRVESSASGFDARARRILKAEQTGNTRGLDSGDIRIALEGARQTQSRERGALLGGIQSRQSRLNAGFSDPNANSRTRASDERELAALQRDLARLDSEGGSRVAALEGQLRVAQRKEKRTSTLNVQDTARGIRERISKTKDRIGLTTQTKTLRTGLSRTAPTRERPTTLTPTLQPKLRPANDISLSLRLPSAVTTTALISQAKQRQEDRVAFQQTPGIVTFGITEGLIESAKAESEALKREKENFLGIPQRVAKAIREPGILGPTKAIESVTEPSAQFFFGPTRRRQREQTTPLGNPFLDVFDETIDRPISTGGIALAEGAIIESVGTKLFNLATKSARVRQLAADPKIRNRAQAGLITVLGGAGAVDITVQPTAELRSRRAAEITRDLFLFTKGAKAQQNIEEVAFGGGRNIGSLRVEQARQVRQLTPELQAEVGPLLKAQESLKGFELNLKPGRDGPKKVKFGLFQEDLPSGVGRTNIPPGQLPNEAVRFETAIVREGQRQSGQFRIGSGRRPKEPVGFGSTSLAAQDFKLGKRPGDFDKFVKDPLRTSQRIASEEGFSVRRADLPKEAGVGATIEGEFGPFADVKDRKLFDRKIALFGGRKNTVEIDGQLFTKARREFAGAVEGSLKPGRIEKDLPKTRKLLDQIVPRVKAEIETTKNPLKRTRGESFIKLAVESKAARKPGKITVPEEVPKDLFERITEIKGRFSPTRQITIKQDPILSVKQRAGFVSERTRARTGRSKSKKTPKTRRGFIGAERIVEPGFVAPKTQRVKTPQIPRAQPSFFKPATGGSRVLGGAGRFLTPSKPQRFKPSKLQPQKIPSIPSILRSPPSTFKGSAVPSASSRIIGSSTSSFIRQPPSSSSFFRGSSSAITKIDIPPPPPFVPPTARGLGLGGSGGRRGRRRGRGRRQFQFTPTLIQAQLGVKRQSKGKGGSFSGLGLFR